MFFIVLSAMLFVCSGSAQIVDNENCDTSELKVCVKITPRTQIGLPRNKDELDAHCQAYNIGMTCMDSWIKKCLPTDSQKLVQRQIGGARALMRYLCSNDTALRRDYIKESSCWARVSPNWSQCVDELQGAVKEIWEQSQLLTYINRNVELCCARDDFLTCVAYVGRPCSEFAGILLSRMAWVLAQDVATCSQEMIAHCSAPSPPIAAPLLTAISSVILYPPRW